MSQFIFPKSATVAALLASASCANTAAATGSAVDTRDYEGPLLVIQNHGTGTGTLDGKIQDSDDGSTGWADVTGATFTQSTTTADIQSLALGETKRYIRYVGTIGTGPQVVGVSLSGMKKQAS